MIEYFTPLILQRVEKRRISFSDLWMKRFVTSILKTEQIAITIFDWTKTLTFSECFRGTVKSFNPHRFREHNLAKNMTPASNHTKTENDNGKSSRVHFLKFDTGSPVHIQCSKNIKRLAKMVLVIDLKPPSIDKTRKEYYISYCALQADSFETITDYHLSFFGIDVGE